MSGVVISKCDEIFTPTKGSCADHPTHITVCQLQWMMCPFPSGVLGGQPVALSFHAGYAKISLFFPIKVQSTGHVVLCQRFAFLELPIGQNGDAKSLPLNCCDRSLSRVGEQDLLDRGSTNSPSLCPDAISLDLKFWISYPISVKVVTNPFSKTETMRRRLYDHTIVLVSIWSFRLLDIHSHVLLHGDINHPQLSFRSR